MLNLDIFLRERLLNSGEGRGCSVVLHLALELLNFNICNKNLSFDIHVLKTNINLPKQKERKPPKYFKTRNDIQEGTEKKIKSSSKTKNMTLTHRKQYFKILNIFFLIKKYIYK